MYHSNYSILMLALVLIISGCTTGGAQPTATSQQTTSSAPTSANIVPGSAVSTPTAIAIVTQVAATPSVVATGTVQPTVQPASSVTLVEYANSRYPFRVSFPPDWTISETSGEARGITALSTSADNRPRGAIIVSSIETTGTVNLETEFESAARVIRTGEGVSEFREEPKQVPTINNLQGIRQCYSYKRQNTALRQCTVFLGGKNRIYNLTLVAPQEAFAHYEPVFNAVLPTFREN